MIDFHTHILPGIDDGSDSPEQSIAMLRMEADQGVTHVVLTPHFYPRYDNPEAFLTRRAAAEAALRRAMADHTGLPEVILGAEVHFFRGISDSDSLPQLTFSGNRCILIEMPPPPWSDSMYRELAAIREKRDIIPVIAHIDRYIRPLRTCGIPERLSELPVLVQANAGFFLDRFAAPLALRLLREDQIQLLGSDCHNLTTRAPNLGAAGAVIRRKLGEEALARIYDYAEDILSLR